MGCTACSGGVSEVKALHFEPGWSSGTRANPASPNGFRTTARLLHDLPLENFGTPKFQWEASLSLRHYVIEAITIELTNKRVKQIVPKKESFMELC
jgi:hypothetical protein